MTQFLLAASSASLPAQTISGRVYDSVTKAPLAGATVELVPSARKRESSAQFKRLSQASMRCEAVVVWTKRVR